MSHADPFKNETWARLQGFTCLVPIFGLFPAGWVLARRNSDPKIRKMSRLSITLGVLWGLGFFLMNTSVGFTDSESGAGVAMLLSNTVWSSGYFVTLLWLMTRYWRKQSVTVPGVSAIAKYLP